MVKQRRPVCRCKAYNFPHRKGGGDCDGGDYKAWLATVDRNVADTGDDYTEDHRLDSPTKGLAAEINKLNRSIW